MVTADRPTDLIGMLTRTYVRDVPPRSNRPSIIVMEGRSCIAKYQYRIFRSGLRYRTEWLDGAPRRVFNGTQLWDFNEDGSLRLLLDSETGDDPTSVRPYIFPLPPRPIESDTLDVEPLSTQHVQWLGRDHIEVTYPVSADRPREIGYKHLIDPESSYLVRISYGDDDIQTTEGTDVHVVDRLPDALFNIAPPTA